MPKGIEDLNSQFLKSTHWEDVEKRSIRLSHRDEIPAENHSIDSIIREFVNRWKNTKSHKEANVLLHSYQLHAY